MPIAERVGLCVLLTFVLVIYLVFGSLLFVAIEGPYRGETHVVAIETLGAIIQNLEDLKLSLDDSTDLYATLEDSELSILNETAALASDLLFMKKQEHVQWNLQTGIHFCMTVVTTIGYGYIAPVTQLGRGICIPYSLIGITLNIILSGNIGHLLAQAISKLYEWIEKCCHSRRLSRGSPAEQNGGPQETSGDEDENHETTNGAVREETQRTTVHYINGAYCNAEIILTTNAPIDINSHPPTADAIPSQPDAENGRSAPVTSPEENSLQDKAICPIWFNFLILTLFCSGSALLLYWGNVARWTFLEALYYIVETFATVGFGDFDHNIKASLNADSFNWWIRIYTYVIMEVGLILVAMTATIWSENTAQSARRAREAVKRTKIVKQIVSSVSRSSVDENEEESVQP